MPDNANQTDPESIRSMLGYIGTLIAGVLGGEGVRRTRKPKATLADVIDAIKHEGKETRGEIYKASKEETKEHAKIAEALAKLDGRMSK